MMRSLLLKELRAQRGFIFLAIGFLLIDTVDDLTLRANLTLAQLNGELTAMSMMLLMVSFAIGSGLLIREFDSNTLSFIDGLPTTRHRLFVAKILVTLIVLQLLPLLTIVKLVLFHLVQSNSLDRAIHWNLLLASYVLLLVPILVGSSAGLLLGFFRGMSWVMFGSLIVLVVALSSRWPMASVLSPQQLLSGVFTGARVHWPVAALLVQLALALGAFIVAATLFSITDTHRMLSRINDKPWVTTLVTLSCITIFGVSIYLSIKASRQQVSQSEYISGAHFDESPPGNSATLHYTFSYPANRSEAVAKLLEQADKIFDGVANILRIDGGANIDVDLNGSMLNTEGTAFPNRIRMNLSKSDEAGTLAHETAHVFARRVVGDAGEGQLNGMTVFNEGLARWIERQMLSDRKLEHSDELAAAVVSARHVLDTHDLVNIQAMSTEVDENLKYPLGKLFIDCLIKRYGDEAPLNILKAIGREDFPRDLNGFPLWQAAFQLAEYDLSLVLDDYARRIKMLERHYKDEVMKLPRLHGDLVVRDNNKDVGIEVYADKDMPDGWRAIVRFKPTVNSTIEMYFTYEVEDDVSWPSEEVLGSGDVCFQPGISNQRIVIYEKWTCLPRSSASEW